MDRKHTDVRDQDLMSHPRHFLRAVDDDGVMRLPASARRRAAAADSWHAGAADHFGTMDRENPLSASDQPRTGLGASARAFLQRGETSVVLLVVALTALGYLSLTS